MMMNTIASALALNAGTARSGAIAPTLPGENAPVAGGVGGDFAAMMRAAGADPAIAPGDMPTMPGVGAMPDGAGAAFLDAPIAHAPPGNVAFVAPLIAGEEPHMTALDTAATDRMSPVAHPQTGKILPPGKPGLPDLAATDPIGLTDTIEEGTRPAVIANPKTAAKAVENPAASMQPTPLPSSLRNATAARVGAEMPATLPANTAARPIIATSVFSVSGNGASKGIGTGAMAITPALPPAVSALLSEAQIGRVGETQPAPVVPVPAALANIAPPPSTELQAQTLTRSPAQATDLLAPQNPEADMKAPARTDTAAPQVEGKGRSEIPLVQTGAPAGTAALPATMPPSGASHSPAPMIAAGSDAARIAAHDFGAVVDRLATARETAQPAAARIAVTHAEFGQVGVRFDGAHAGSAGNATTAAMLNVTLTNADPDFAPAVMAALSERAGERLGERVADRGTERFAEQGQSGTRQDGSTQDQPARHGDARNLDRGHGRQNDRTDRDSVFDREFANLAGSGERSRSPVPTPRSVRSRGLYI
ncbi:hypothetical protein [uncultured Croceicoccus sp.]|uniref:hypothetical protein n=1 Tax=uncultured Croceicoccus sp. TaxID=1295329 RepID=UPI002631A12A|nr:hypothetical protein [uncultured Croceicoccus sp.]